MPPLARLEELILKIREIHHRAAKNIAELEVHRKEALALIDGIALQVNGYSVELGATATECLKQRLAKVNPAQGEG